MKTRFNQALAIKIRKAKSIEEDLDIESKPWQGVGNDRFERYLASNHALNASNPWKPVYFAGVIQ